MKIKIGGSVSVLKSFNVCFAGLHCQLKDFSELFFFLPFIQIKQVAVGSVPVIQPRSTLPTAGVFYRPDRVQCALLMIELNKKVIVLNKVSQSVKL